jgi:hypothetical protein
MRRRSQITVDFVKNFLDFLSGDFFGVHEVLEEILDSLDGKFEVDGLYEFAFGLLIFDFFVYKGVNFFAEF